MYYLMYYLMNLNQEAYSLMSLIRSSIWQRTHPTGSWCSTLVSKPVRLSTTVRNPSQKREIPLHGTTQRTITQERHLDTMMPMKTKKLLAQPSPNLNSERHHQSNNLRNRRRKNFHQNPLQSHLHDKIFCLSMIAPTAI